MTKLNVQLHKNVLEKPSINFPWSGMGNFFYFLAEKDAETGRRMEGTKLLSEHNLACLFEGLLTLPLGKCDKFSTENSYYDEDNCCLISTEKYLTSQYLKESL